jgi:hypothetical protein
VKNVRSYASSRQTMRKAWEEPFKGDLAAAFCMWRLAHITEDGEAIKLFQRAIPVFWCSAFTFAGAECRLDLELRYMAMHRYNDALLHLEIAMPEFRANGTSWLAAFCRAAIIVCLRENVQPEVAQAKLAMETSCSLLQRCE